MGVRGHESSMSPRRRQSGTPNGARFRPAVAAETSRPVPKHIEPNRLIRDVSVHVPGGAASHYAPDPILVHEGAHLA
jgi:hypothetical protein